MNFDGVPGGGAPRCWRIDGKQFDEIVFVSDRSLQNGKPIGGERRLSITAIHWIAVFFAALAGRTDPATFLNWSMVAIYSYIVGGCWPVRPSVAYFDFRSGQI